MTKNLKIITITLTILIVLFFGLRGKIAGEKFNSEKWKNADFKLEENWSIRWDMMNSLRNENELIGKSYDEIIRILGKPDDETKNELYYNLGYTGNGINTGNLTIEIDEERKVINIKVREG
jgi:hypothetical protein